MKQTHTPVITQLIPPRVGPYPSKTSSKVSTMNGLCPLTVAPRPRSPAKPQLTRVTHFAGRQLPSCPRAPDPHAGSALQLTGAGTEHHLSSVQGSFASQPTFRQSPFCFSFHCV